MEIFVDPSPNGTSIPSPTSKPLNSKVIFGMDKRGKFGLRIWNFVCSNIDCNCPKPPLNIPFSLLSSKCGHSPDPAACKSKKNISKICSLQLPSKSQKSSFLNQQISISENYQP